ncbi:fibronectin type III domain-containing protein [SCandidatus Aminicenantes bacterium Aminicenantia_JdfR_composite]|nr:fibronectin type III domain-containing protein [SCandidatus Aminicenantes bacterium Aminicenantia_JdfR_composite]
MILFIFLINCGRKAPPLPPIIKIPKTVTDLKVKQIGNNIFLSWKNPISYTDGSPLSKIGKIQIYIYEKEKNYKYFKINKKEFFKKSKLIEINETESFIYPLENKKMNDKELVFGIIVKDNRNKASELSKTVSIKPGIPPLPPRNLSFTVYEDKILLKWEKPENANFRVEGYRVYRWDEESKKPMALNSNLLEQTIFEDKNFVFNKKYFYTVRSIAYTFLKYIPLPYPFLFFSTQKEKKSVSEIESENSNVVEVIPMDTFPPDPPKGLVGITEESAITLMWDPNSEKDLEGYKVWRKGENEEKFSLLTPIPISSNSFKDDKVKKDTTYYYFVTAIDRRKNESEKSKIIEIKFEK